MAEFSKISQKVCADCGEILSKNKFYASPIKSGEYIPICKKCLDKRYKTFADKILSMKPRNGRLAALWCVLFQANIPFYKELGREVDDKISDKDTSPVGAYMTLLANSNAQFNDALDGDTPMEEYLSMKSVIKSNADERDMVVISDDSLSEADKRLLRHNWGEYPPSDWEWLEGELHDYIDGIDGVDEAGIKVYRNLCKADLRLKQANERGEDTKAITDEILKWMKLLKIDNFKSNERSEVDKFIDRMAWKFEQTEPAELEDENAYRDIAGYEAMYKEIMRSMENFVKGSKNYPPIPKDEQ